MTVMAAVNLPGAWVLSNQTLTPAGHVFTGPAPRRCMSSTAPFSACQTALGKLGLRQLVTYQPAGRYWAFQWYETGIFVVLALGLGRGLRLEGPAARLLSGAQPPVISAAHR